MVVTSEPRYAYYSRRQPDLAVSKFVSSSKRVSRQPARHAASRRCRVQRILKRASPLPPSPPSLARRKEKLLVPTTYLPRVHRGGSGGILPAVAGSPVVYSEGGPFANSRGRVSLREGDYNRAVSLIPSSFSCPIDLSSSSARRYVCPRKFSRIENFGIVDRGNVIYSTLCQGFRFNKLSNDTSENPFQKGYYILIEILLRKLCIDYRLLNRESFQKKIFFDGGRLKLDVHSVYYAT